MRLKKFDLNLLVTLDALLTERSTTRAAKHLNISQPTVSNALARLREYFQDELLTHVGHRLIPTTLGQSLVDPIHDLVMRAGATLDRRPGFDMQTASRKFTIAASDYASVLLLSEVARRAEQIAPNISFEFRPLRFPGREQVEQGDLDLIVMPDIFLSDQHAREALYTETFVCVVWRGNSRIGERISIEQLRDLRHVVPNPGISGRSPSIIERWLDERIGRQRSVATWVPDFAAIPQFITGTGKVAVMHRALAERFAGLYELRLLEMPAEFPLLHMAMQWHRHRNSDSGLAWLREIIHTVVADRRMGMSRPPPAKLAARRRTRRK